jgi:hypothetical protein
VDSSCKLADIEKQLAASGTKNSQVETDRNKQIDELRKQLAASETKSSQVETDRNKQIDELRKQLSVVDAKVAERKDVDRLPAADLTVCHDELAHCLDIFGKALYVHLSVSEWMHPSSSSLSPFTSPLPSLLWSSSASSSASFSPSFSGNASHAPWTYCIWTQRHRKSLVPSVHSSMKHQARFATCVGTDFRSPRPRPRCLVRGARTVKQMILSTARR